MRTFRFIVFLLALSHCIFGQTHTAGEERPSYGLNGSSKTRRSDSIPFVPKPIGWTNDFAHLFSKTEVENLDSLISSYEKETSVEFALATIDSSMARPVGFETYTLQIFRSWGVGKKEKNNGILIVIARDLKRARIQNGYGIEKVLTDKETKTILDSVMMPNFRQGLYFTGAKEGILAIIEKLGQNGL